MTSFYIELRYQCHLVNVKVVKWLQLHQGGTPFVTVQVGHSS